jgi:hypothetical protein
MMVSLSLEGKRQSSSLLLLELTIGKCQSLAPLGSCQPSRMVAPAWLIALTSCLVKMTVRLASQRGAMLTRVLVNDGMMWPWQADGRRFVSLSWALAE